MFISIFSLALLCLILEIFLPGGILGLLALFLFSYACIEAYSHSAVAGHLAVIVSLISTLFSVYFTFKKLPHSKWGKTLFLLNQKAPAPVDEKEKLIGQEAIAETDLRPVGKICIEKKHYDACTQGDYIKKGSTIKIIKIEAQQLIVELTA